MPEEASRLGFALALPFVAGAEVAVLTLPLGYELGRAFAGSGDMAGFAVIFFMAVFGCVAGITAFSAALYGFVFRHRGGRDFLRHAFWTGVLALCASLGTLIFLGGKSLYPPALANIGVVSAGVFAWRTRQATV